MTSTKPQGIGDFRHAQCMLLGFVLSAFGIACGFHTFWHSTRAPSRSAIAWSAAVSTTIAINYVIRRTNRPVRRAELAKLAAPKYA